MSKTVQYYYKKQKDFAKAMEVKNNLLTLHALDYAIVVPSDSKDGFYTNILENIVDENPIDNFVDTLDHNYVNSLTVSVKDLKWVDLASSTNEVNGIHVLNGVLTATNGFYLNRITLDTVSDDIDFIIPAQAIKIINKLAIEYSLKKVKISYTQPEKKSIRNSIRLSLSENIYVDVKSVDGQFPNCQRVIPYNYEDFPVMKWNGLTREQYSKLYNASIYKIKKVTFNDGSLAVAETNVAISYDVASYYIAGFNLAFLNNIVAGDLYLNPNSESASVSKNGNKFSLIMPMRL